MPHLLRDFDSVLEPDLPRRLGAIRRIMLFICVAVHLPRRVIPTRPVTGRRPGGAAWSAASADHRSGRTAGDARLLRGAKARAGRIAAYSAPSCSGAAQAYPR